jgi:hypothetical protein
MLKIVYNKRDNLKINSMHKLLMVLKGCFMKKWLTTVFFIILTSVLVSAQEDDFPAENYMNFDEAYVETITDTAFFDWWYINLSEGDTIRVEMQGSDGLIPLVGVLGFDRTIIARSDETETPVMNGIAILEFRADQEGEYTIIATRQGNQEGTSVGTYSIMASLTNFIPERVPLGQEVQFVCGELTVSNAISINFLENVVLTEGAKDGDIIERYGITSYGFGDFQPVIRAFADVQEAMLDCTRDGTTLPDSTFNIPNYDSVTITEDRLSHIARLIMQNLSVEDRYGEIRLTIGSLDGARGQYMVLIDGLEISEISESDFMDIAVSPLAQNITYTVYMIGDNNSRLDPAILAYDTNSGETIAGCDDAGSRACPLVSSIDGLELFLADSGGVFIEGDRFDAGITIEVVNTTPVRFEFQARNGSTTGRYSILILAELP